jgi:hypothetical protein
MLGFAMLNPAYTALDSRQERAGMTGKSRAGRDESRPYFKA